ncbi:isomerase [Zobellella denitrificans]|uniref:Isomerase n=1 Tax=Zobellella denitrificans TaxID=347534 RepID=A0A291HNM5_9GAMM|nr:TIM barrel protein [Zobellella denitrificans]ATG73767.1 isomerase [Zobellella denitrificans]
MLNFSAHLGFQFTEVPFAARFGAAAAAGYRAVEFPSPYEQDAGELAELLARHQLQLVQFATPMGDGKGLAALAGRKEEFREGLHQALHYARRLGCRRLHLMSGCAGPDEPADATTYLDNIRYAVAFLADQGIQSLIEVIGEASAPGYFMSRFERAEWLFDAVDSPGLGLIFDSYHASRLGGDPLALLDAWWPRLGHVQVADDPGRHEPGTGRLDFPALFALLERRGYPGWIGCEYHPHNGTEAGLGWLAAYMAGR